MTSLRRDSATVGHRFDVSERRLRASLTDLRRNGLCSAEWLVVKNLGGFSPSWGPLEKRFLLKNRVGFSTPCCCVRIERVDVSGAMAWKRLDDLRRAAVRK